MQRKRGSSKKYTSKGRSRYVATPEEIMARNQAVDTNQEEESSSGEESEELPPSHSKLPSEQQQDGSYSDEDSDGGSSSSSGFEIYNPNRNPRPIEKTGIIELSRREREELKRQNFEKNKMTLMAQGKLKTAQEDLARLAQIRKEREEAMARKLEQMSLKNNQ